MMDKHDAPSDGSVVTTQNSAENRNQDTAQQDFIALLVDDNKDAGGHQEAHPNSSTNQEEDISVDADPVDTHTCAACRIVFTRLEDYVQHKLSKDNCKVHYKKQRRLLIPQIVKREPVIPRTESETLRRRGRKKGSKLQRIPLTEDTQAEGERYSCEICQRSFGRSAALRNHVSRDHHRGDSDDEDAVNPGGDAPEDPTSATEHDDPVFKYQACKKSVRMSKACVITQKTVQCAICKGLYKDQYTLKAHMIMHSDDNFYFCKWKGCSFSFKTKGSLKRHMRRHTGERPYKCDKCGMSFAESGALTRHWKARTPCTNKSNSDYPCYGKKKPLHVRAEDIRMKVEGGDNEDSEAVAEENVTEELTQDDAITQSQEIAEMELTEQQPNITPNDIDGNMVTYVVEQVVGAEESVSMEGTVAEGLDESQFADDLETVSVCVVCEMKFTDGSSLQEHLVSHFGLSSLKCCLCESILPLPFQLAEHLLINHPSEVLMAADMSMVPLLAVAPDIDPDKATEDVMDEAAGEVNRALQQFLILNKQTESLGSNVENETFFQCGVCTNFYQTKWQLKGHFLTTHDKKKSFPCEICGKTFHMKDALSKHMTSHSEERNYKCGECGKTFKRISHVREHLKVHSSERPYPCPAPMCGKSFKTANAAKVHLRTHTNYTPYQCSACRKAFREKSSLERHQRTHTGEKPFSCKRCGRCFSEHGTLNRHMKAKVPCTQTSLEQQAEEQQQQQQETPSLLAEFSSMVADTQQYIVHNEDKDQYVTLVSDGGDMAPDNRVIMVQDGLTENSVLHGSVHYVNDQGELVSTDGGNQSVQYLLVESGSDGQMNLVMPPEGGQVADAHSGVLGADSQEVEYTVVAMDDGMDAVHEVDVKKE